MDRRNFLYHICNLIGICNNNFLCLLTAQIGKFFQHLLCRSKIKRSLVVCIRKSIPCHDDTAVNLILRIHKMHVTGRNNRLSELISKFDDFLIQLDQILIGIYAVVFFICKHKCIISKRLDFQIIIKIDQSGDFRFRCISKQCLVKLPGLAGTSYQKSLSVLQKKTLWNSRSSPVIFQM